jgi:hypothetical protein
VQKGKFAEVAFALLKQLNRVDFPTLGSPTIPHFIGFDSGFKKGCEDTVSIEVQP